jgi:tetratricopeptide (TPR) repeat protein
MSGQAVDFYIYYLHALVLQRQDPRGNRPAILQSLDHSLRRNPRFAPAYVQRGRVRADVGETESALADYKTATELDPNYAPTYYHLAQAYFKTGKKEEAEAAQRRFAALNKEQEEREQKNQIANRVFQSLQ